MAARFKKRPPGSVNNKNIKLDMLTLYDLMCPICQSIYIEPVTLPCCHNFCLTCFNGSVENNALACPLCRTRIGSWLRTTTKQNKLVNTKLWEYIQKYYENEVNGKLNGGEVTMIKDETTRILSAPGEIRSEYESEVERLRKEQKALEEKQAKESEKLIRELQEQELKLSEERQAKLKQDEELARQLAENSQAVTLTEESSDKSSSHVQPNGHTVTSSHSHTSSNGNINNTLASHSKSKQFYDYLAATTSSTPSHNKGTKSNTLDRYVVKSNGSANGYKKVHSAEYIVGSPPSPELMSTAGRCGRFLKNFLTARLWGSSVTGCPNSSKTEPKVWEPQDTCAGHSRELSVNTGVVQHHHQPQPPMQQRQLNMDDSITQEVINLDTISEDSLAQELCYFKPLHPEPINRFPGKCRRSIPMRPTQKQHEVTDVTSPDVSSLMDGLERLKGPLFWKQAPPTLSPFVCLVQVPVQLIKARESSKSSDKSQTVIKPNKKTIKRKHNTPTKAADILYNTRSPSKSVTPRKAAARKALVCGDKRNAKRTSRLSNASSNSKDTSPRKHATTNQSLSRSCVKLCSNNSNTSDHVVLTRSKRSISFGDASTNERNGNINKLSTKMTNGVDTNLMNNSTRTLRSNGLITKANDCDIKLSNGSRKTSLNDEHHVSDRNGIPHHNNNYYGRNLSKSDKCLSNGNTEVLSTNGEFVFDASLVEEQKRIEEMIAQEKKDFALAKKLQKQFCGNDYISTGYTMRTAAKKQATLRDILPVAKKMKV